MSRDNITLNVILDKITEICEKQLSGDIDYFDECTVRIFGDILYRGADNADLEHILEYLRPLARGLKMKVDNGDDLIEPCFAALSRTIAKIEKRRSSNGAGTQPSLFDENQLCICPRTCDCQCPDPETGPALISNHCPFHNSRFIPSPDCFAEKHWREEGPCIFPFSRD